MSVVSSASLNKPLASGPRSARRARDTPTRRLVYRTSLRWHTSSYVYFTVVWHLLPFALLYRYSVSETLV